MNHTTSKSSNPWLNADIVLALAQFGKLSSFEPYKLSQQATEFLNDMATVLQNHFSKLLPAAEFRFIAFADGSSRMQFKKWGTEVRAKTIALELRRENESDFFTIPKDSYAEVKTKGELLAETLGLRLIVADFFQESSPPDCGKIYEASRRKRTTADGSRKVAFALASAEDCILGNRKAASVTESFNNALHGKNSEELSEIVRLIKSFRSELLMAEQSAKVCQ